MNKKCIKAIIAIVIVLVTNVSTFSATEGTSQTLLDFFNNTGRNGLFFGGDNKLYYYENNEVNTDVTGVVFSEGQGYYFESGAHDVSFSGFSKEYGSKDVYYVQEGYVDLDVTGLVNGSVNNSKGLWYIQNNKVDLKFSGTVKYSSAVYYIKKGKPDKSKTGIIKCTIGKKSGYWYISHGKISLKKTGFIKGKIKNKTAWHYFKNSRFLSKTKGFIKGTVNGKKALWYVKNGRILTEKTGLVSGKVNGKSGKWYVKNGRIRVDYSGIIKSSNIYLYIKNGKYDPQYTNVITHNGKQWNVILGKATKVKTEYDKTLSRAIKVVVKVTDKNMTKAQKLRKVYDYVKDAYIEKNPRLPHYHGKNWEIIYANDMLVNGTGNCMSYGAALGFMAKAIGYKNIYACNSGGHGWAEIEGLVYDAEWERHKNGESYFGLSYDKCKSPNYKGAISPGYPWMHVAI